MIRKYYKILDLDVGASQDEIKKAYRNKAKDLHPDVNDSPESTAKFQEIYNAYIYLSSNPQATDLGLNSKPKYKYTSHAPTDPKEYQWWYQETIRRKAKSDDDYRELSPEYVQFRKKQRELAKQLGRLLYCLLGMPIAFFFAYFIAEEFFTYLYVVCIVLCLFSLGLFFKGIIRGKRPPYKFKT